MNHRPDHKQLALECRNLNKSFGGFKAIDDMSLKVETGKITGLIGPNGAGKSTLFNLISGVMRADSGQVRLFGDDITREATYKIARRGLIRTFQLSREMEGMTILENLMLAPQQQTGERMLGLWFKPRTVALEEDEIAAKAEIVLEQINLTAVANEYAGNVSGGQKKLLEIGRVLMIDPSVVLLDEPAAGVNPTLMGLLAESIVRLKEEFGKTILVVEHDMDLIAHLCDRVVVMAEGTFLCDGTFDEVVANKQVPEAYLGIGKA
jgi:branched-chain amino acid transport system ATP-binding protein